MELNSNLTLGSNASILSWDYLAANWGTAPAQVGTATVSTQAGVVLSYTLRGVTRFRFVPDTYSPQQDAFYSNYSGGVLSGLIVTRG
jgi:hypothetical protein